MKLIHAAVTAILVSASAAISAHAASMPNFIGQLVQTESADRTIVVDANTRHVNVTQGEKVKFVVSGREFVVAFDGIAQDIDLGELAPRGVLDHPVLTHVDAGPFMGAN
jgi:hypothetical protein